MEDRQRRVPAAPRYVSANHWGMGVIPPVTSVLLGLPTPAFGTRQGPSEVIVWVTSSSVARTMNG